MVSLTELEASAVALRGLPAYGLLGTLRLLRSRVVREAGAAWSLHVALPAPFLLLPHLRGLHLPHSLRQPSRDSLGNFAERLAGAATFGEIEALLHEHAPDAPEVARLRKVGELALGLTGKGESDTFGDFLLLSLKTLLGRPIGRVLDLEEQAPEDPGGHGETLNGLTRGVEALSKSIDEKSRHLLAAPVRALVREDRRLMSRQWPEAEPDWTRHPSNATADPGRLDDLLGKVRAGAHLSWADRDDYLDQIFILPQQSAQEAAHKARFLEPLASRYVERSNASALRRGLESLTRALCILRAQGDTSEVDLADALRRCFEARASTYIRLAETFEVGPAGGRNSSRARSWRESAYRDYLISLGIPAQNEPPSEENYLFAGERARDTETSSSEALQSLRQRVASHPDFADGHLTLFWRIVEDAGLGRHRRSPPIRSALPSPTRPPRGEQLGAIEEATSALDAALLSTFFHHRSDEKARAQPRLWALGRIGPEAVLQLIHLRKRAAGLYLRAKSDEERACAVLHLSRAILEVDLLRQMVGLRGGGRGERGKSRRLRELMDLELGLRRQRAEAYGRLRLHHCQATEVGRILTLVKAHLSLARRLPHAQAEFGRVYLRQGPRDEAKALLESALDHTLASKSVRRRARCVLREFERADLKAARNSDGPALTDLLLFFQDHRILAESRQKIEDSERACLAPFAWPWTDMRAGLTAASSIREWVEVLLAHVRLDARVTPDRVLLLTRLAEAEGARPDLDRLGEMKKFLADAHAEILQDREHEKDAHLRTQKAAEEKLERIEAFDAVLHALHTCLLKGEQIRPGSEQRGEVELLSRQLSAARGGDLKEVTATLGRLLGDLDANAIRLCEEHRDYVCKKVGAIVDTMLDGDFDIDVDEPTDQGGTPRGFRVLTVVGTSLFWSQCRDEVVGQVGDNVREVHLIAENLYIDEDMSLPGVNVYLGGQRVEWMRARKSDGDDRPLTIGLSGRPGNDVPEQEGPKKAASGNSHGERGHDGDKGDAGQQGQSAGDLVVHPTEACENFSAEVIASIRLIGGPGGSGGRGQAGGDGQEGEDGKAGEKASHGFWRDLGNVFTGFDYHFEGSPGGRAGGAGMGGPGGAGGAGGRPGQLITRGAAAGQKSASVRGEVVEGKAGDDGTHGERGEGGHGAEGGQDGPDLVQMRKMVLFFTRTHEKKGHGLHCIAKDRRKLENWVESDPDGKRGRARGQTQANTDICRDDLDKQRLRDQKVHADADAFSEHLEIYLAHHASDRQQDAIEGVSDLRAVTEDHVEALEARGEELETTLEAMRQEQEITASKVAESQEVTQTQTKRLAGPPAKSARLEGDAIPLAYDGEGVNEPPDNLLSFSLSPVSHPRGQALVAHPLEVAMQAVNDTLGGDVEALTDVIEGLGRALASTSKPIGVDRARALLGRLTELAANLPLEALIRQGLGEGADQRRLANGRGGKANRKPDEEQTNVPQALAAAITRLTQAVASDPGALDQSLEALGTAVDGRLRLGEKAQSLYDRISQLVGEKCGQQLRRSLTTTARRRGLSADRLLFGILAADAGFGSREIGEEPRWVVERLTQKVTRVLSQAGEPTGGASVSDGEEEDIVEALRAEAREAAPADTAGVKALLDERTRALAAEAQATVATLRESRRQVESRLARVCARLATQGEDLPGDLADGDLAGILAFLEDADCMPVPEVDAPELPPPASAGTVPSAAGPNSLEEVAESVRARMPAAGDPTRLCRHLERQLEVLHGQTHGDEAEFLARAAAAFEEVYGVGSALADQELIPLAGEVATALLMCGETETRQFLGWLGDGVEVAPDEGCRRILRGLMHRPHPWALEVDLAARARATKDASPSLLTAAESGCDFLGERTRRQTVEHLAERAPPQSKSPSPEQARAFWSSWVSRWSDLAELVPAHDVLALARAYSAREDGAGRSVDAVLTHVARTVHPAANPEGEEVAGAAVLLKRLSDELAASTPPALTEGAAASLFLLVSGELEAEELCTLVEKVCRHLSVDDQVSSEDGKEDDSDDAADAPSPLEVGLALLDHRASDMGIDLAESWHEALTLVQEKLRLVRQDGALAEGVSTAHIGSLLCFIDRAAHRCAPAARVRLFAEATQAARRNLIHVADDLEEVKLSLLSELARLDSRDGWDPDLVEAYNAHLEAGASADDDAHRAQADRFLRLVEGLSGERPAAANDERLGAALSVGIPVLNLTPEQQVELYGQLLRFGEAGLAVDDTLDEMQRGWSAALDGVKEEIEAEEARRESERQHQRGGLLLRLGDLVQSRELPRSASVLGEAELFVVLLDRHHAASGWDAGGERRLEIYAQVRELAEGIFGGGSDAKAEVAKFLARLRDLAWHELRPDQADRRQDFFRDTLGHLTSRDGVQLDDEGVEAFLADLEPLLWRGTLPYFAEEGDSALSLLRQHLAKTLGERASAAEQEPHFAELARHIKVKFDSRIALVDASDARETVRELGDGARARRGGIFDQMQRWLGAARIDGESVEKVLGLGDKLRAAFANPREAQTLDLGGEAGPSSAPRAGDEEAGIENPEAFDAWLSRTAARVRDLSSDAWAREVPSTLRASEGAGYSILSGASR